MFPEMDLPWTDTDDRSGFDGISLKIIEVLTLALEQIQFEIVMSMDPKPVWSLRDRFLNHADKNAGVARHAVGIISDRINRNFARPH